MDEFGFEFACFLLILGTFIGALFWLAALSGRVSRLESTLQGGTPYDPPRLPPSTPGPTKRVP